MQKYIKNILPVVSGVGLILGLLTGGCGKKNHYEYDPFRIVATTTIAADIVQQVPFQRVTPLLPVGADPHGFEPTPADMKILADANVVFLNGLGLEHSLANLLEAAGTAEKEVVLSQGISPRTFEPHQEEAEEAEHEHHEGHHHTLDPHVWMDPVLVMDWVRVVTETMCNLDPKNDDQYKERAAAYIDSLEQLDTWIREQVATIPEDQRKLVTDHRVFGYFAQRYGFETTGTVFQGVSTLAEPSAQELAALEDQIRAQGVRAIFTGTTVNPQLSERIASDTGVKLVRIYTGSLGEPGGEADTYLNYMRFNVNAIVRALK